MTILENDDKSLILRLEAKTRELEASLRVLREDLAERRSVDMRHARQREALIGLSNNLNRPSGDLTTMLRQITEVVSRALGAARVSVWRYNECRDGISCVSAFDAGTGHHSSGLELSAASYLAYFRALEESEVISVDDAARDPRTAEFAEAYLAPLGITAMLDAPLHVGGVLGGVLCHEHVAATPRHWTADERTFAVAAANLVSLVLEGSERQQTEHALRQSQALLQVASSVGHLGAWSIDVPSLRSRWSDEARRIHEIDKVPVDQVTVDALLEFYPSADRRRLRAAFLGCVRDGTPFDQGLRFVTARQRRGWVRVIGTAVRDDAGNIVRVQGAIQDISEQKAAAEEIRTLAHKLHHTLDKITDGFFTLDREWRFTYANDEAVRQFQLPLDRLLGHSLWETFQDVVGTVFEREYRRAVEQRVTVSFEACYAPHDKWIEVKAYPTPDGLAVYFRDVTERRKAREALRQSDERFRLLGKSTNDAIWDWDLKTDSVWWNEGFARIFGFASAEEVSTIASWTAHIHPDDRERVAESLRNVAAEGHDGWSCEYRFARQDGSYAYVLDRGYVLRDADGPLRMIGAMTDLSARKQAEDQLREQATLLDHARDAIIVLDLDHHIVYWNLSAQRLYGWTAEEADRQRFDELLGCSVAPFRAAIEVALTQGAWMGEIGQTTRNGAALTVEGHWTLVRDDRGAPKSILTINTDVTQRKRLEQQQLRAQRLESIGTLAGGIAHDLNNVLAPILMSIDLLRVDESDKERRDILDTIESSATRGAAMVAQVLSFARGLEGKRIEVNTTFLVHDLTKIVSETFPRNIRIDEQVGDNVWSVLADATQLHQVLLNLCVNARDAMPSGGLITIRAENACIDEHQAAMNLEARIGPHVRIDVEDTGTGIAPEVIERIFDPFFTTKETGHGTGLGLSTSLAIIKGHGGFIRVYSEMGAGSRFRLYLPAETGPATKVVSIERADLPRGHGEMVLVVDDEASIRKIARQTLEAFGYRVLVASDGSEAVALYTQHQADIAVVLTDIMMPVMDGTATMHALQQLNPQVRIIGASGLTTNDQKAQTAGIRHFLAKPYTAESLLLELRRILAG